MNQSVFAMWVTGVWQPIENNHQTEVVFWVSWFCLEFFVYLLLFFDNAYFCIAALGTGPGPWAQQTQSCSWTARKEPVPLISHSLLEQSFSSVNHSPTLGCWFCSCCGCTFTHPGFPRHSLKVTKLPGWEFRHSFISCQGSSAINLAVALCSQIVTPLFCLYAQSYTGKPRNFANSAPST